MFWTILKRFRRKKFFSKNFRFFWSFLAILWPKKLIVWLFLGRNFDKNFSSISKGLYCGHFAPLHSSLRLLSSAGSLDLSNFWPKMAKNRVFSKILGPKKCFWNFFYQNFGNTFCGIFKPSYIHVSLPISARSSNELIAPLGFSTSPLVESGRARDKNLVKTFFWINFCLDLKFSKKTPLFFGHFFVKKSINLVSLQSSIDVGKCAIVQNDRNTILMMKMIFLMWKNIQKFSIKNSTDWFFGQKLTNKSKQLEFFLIEVDFE